MVYESCNPGLALALRTQIPPTSALLCHTRYERTRRSMNELYEEWQTVWHSPSPDAVLNLIPYFDSNDGIMYHSIDTNDGIRLA